MENKIKIGIVGGAGYTAGELIRLLLYHPNAEIVSVHSTSNAGRPLHAVHNDLLGETEMIFSQKLNNDIDVIFLCLGHGEAAKFISSNNINSKIKIIDLSQDFRLGESLQGRQFVYGLPEINRQEIKSANNVSNPGCFATAIQLGLLPLAKAGLLQEVYTTGITGSTGAGQGLSATSHFSWRANNIQAYKILRHQHLEEIGKTLLQCDPSGEVEVNFIPWRGDFTRGIFISSIIKSDKSIEEAYSLFNEYYAEHPFVIISKEAVFLKQVVNTNKCYIQLEKAGNKLVVHSIIDNLLKGASGQAMQNMNLMFSLEETTGLKLKAAAF